MIRQKNGILVEGEKTVVFDGKNEKADEKFISHAHFDHLSKNAGKVITSEETAEIAGERTGGKFEVGSSEILEMRNAGHIIGSQAGLIDDGQRVLYTGDFCPRDRLYLSGFEPVDADVLIIESTYGTSNYIFPDYQEVENRIGDWIAESSEPLFLFAYSLGKAQKIQKIAQKYTDRPVLAHGSVRKMNRAVERATDLKFESLPYGENKDLMEKKGILVAPTSFSKRDSLEKLVEKVGGTKAGFSGWGVQESYNYRGGYDKVFPLSDHADFRELVQTVEEVDPDKVYTTHGFDEAFASFLRNEKGFNARPLKKNQSSLTQFS